MDIERLCREMREMAVSGEADTMALYHSMEFGLKAEQRQILSQKMIQSAQILQMNAQELAGYIRELALENPVVDIVEKAPEEEKDKKK